jgi:hypothetical protein
MEFIAELPELIEDAEKLKGYWDETGLDMHIAAKCDGKIVVSTKHWTRVHYIVTSYSAFLLWKGLGDVSQDIGRKLIRSKKGDYVYIHKLSNKQTLDVFNKIVDRFDGKIERHLEWSWDISDAFIPV